MNESTIQFSDGDAYEHSMGVWSRLAAEPFLTFLDAPRGAKWLDVGCGNGAFTQVITEKYAPAFVEGVDPSEGQLAFARDRLRGTQTRFQTGRADALPFPDSAFDVAAMGLVLFFVPDPAKAVSEMMRVVKSGGLIAAYSWNMLHGGFPFDAIQMALREMGIDAPLPPSVAASQMSTMRDLWAASGSADIRTSVIEVSRTYANFDDMWTANSLVASIRPILGKLPVEQTGVLRIKLAERCPANRDGTITCRAHVNAIVGRKSN